MDKSSFEEDLPRKLNTGQTDGNYNVINPDESVESQKPEKYSFAQSFGATVFKDNLVVNETWKAADSVLTIYEDFTNATAEGYDPLSEEERAKYDPQYWPTIATAKNPYQAGRKVLKTMIEDRSNEILANSSITGSLSGCVYNQFINPLNALTILQAIKSPNYLTEAGKIGQSIGSKFIGGLKEFEKTAVSLGLKLLPGNIAEETLLNYAQETRSVEEGMQNIAVNTFTGAILGASLKTIGNIFKPKIKNKFDFGPTGEGGETVTPKGPKPKGTGPRNFKELVGPGPKEVPETDLGGSAKFYGAKLYKDLMSETLDGAEVKTLINKNGEVTGVSIQDGGSVGAALSKDIPFESTIADFRPLGTGNKFHPASPVMWQQAVLLRNPVALGLTSKSKYVAEFTHSMLEHDLEIEGTAKRGMVTNPPLQSEISRWKNKGVKFEMDFTNFFYKQFGLEDSNKIIRNVTSKFKFPEDALKMDQFSARTALAISQGGIDADYPIVQELAKFTIDNILNPNSEELVKLGVLPSNFTPFGAAQHLQRVYAKDRISADRPRKVQDLVELYGNWNQNIITANTPLENLAIKKGQIETLAAIDKTKDYSKELKRANKAIREQKLKIRNDTIKGLYHPGMLVGDAGMKWEQIEQINKLRKPIKKAKQEFTRAEEELRVYKRSYNEGKKVGQKNKPADESQVALENKLKEAKTKLDLIRKDYDTKVKSEELDKSLFFKTAQGNYRLKKPNYGTQKFRKILDEEELLTAAENTVNNILNLSPDQIAESISGSFKTGSMGSLSGVMNPRVLMADDKWLYEREWLETDLRKTIPTFLTRMGRLIESEKYFRSKEGYIPGETNKMQFLADGISEDYKVLRNTMEENHQAKLSKATTDKQKEKLEKKIKRQRLNLVKKERNDIKLCQTIYSRVMGAVPQNFGGLNKAFRALGSYAHGSNLGLLTLSMLGDVFSPIFRLGPVAYARDGVIPFFRAALSMNGNYTKLKNACADLLMGIDTVKTFSNLNFDYGGIDTELPLGKIGRVTQQLANAMGVLNLSSTMGDILKRVSATASESNMFRNIKKFAQGKLKGDQLAQLKVLRMNDLELCKSIVAQQEIYGAKISGAYKMNFSNWEDGRAAERFQMALHQEVNSTQFSGKQIGSYPADLEFNGLSNYFLFYMGWFFDASAKFLSPLFQRFDKNKIMGMAAIYGISCLSDNLRKLAKGEELTDEDWEPSNIALRGLFNSGILGIQGEIFSRVNAAFDWFPDLKTSKVANKRQLELISSAPYALVDALGVAGGMIFNGEYNKSDIKRIKRQFPLVNAIWFQKLGNDIIDNLDLPETRAEAHKARMEEQGIYPEKKPRKPKKGTE